ncbi:class I SAM-dependent methyltransferase [Oceanobacillus alkalisoli]|uniref:class I SAM-dependent methyltransferase n=1 Tax=Oceanobacillus alkalisoli TaxID=2925113 RepID=UPI001EEFDF4F|nr:class I SAM-dependent methyltransferase [Oceanobacillus alkalisoli]MCF3943334.1 class I SAM-dependent methyltransferase [Oceanobacillus alkalisoli]MCG5103789.1 class I SAM-dependent methyltransferase [Oceanobacillus alkalisoli]
MEKSTVEELFKWFDETTEIIQAHVDEPYLNSLSETMDTVFYETPHENFDDILRKKLDNQIDKFKNINHSKQDLKKAIQLAALNGMKGSVQEQHVMTPESVGMIVAYLANQLMRNNKQIRLFDPAGGTGNLLFTVMEQLEQELKTYASEVDPTLIQLAVSSANLLKQEIEFFHQDSLAPLLLDPVDLVVADLPVGFYPDDIRAGDYELKAEEGHSYAHHLFIEQSMTYTKEAGYLIFVVPDFLFESDQSDQLNRYLKEHAHIVGVLRLPESSFKSSRNVKSILVLQKKGVNTNSPKQPLLVQLPSLTSHNAMADILGQMNRWFQTYEN